MSNSNLNLALVGCGYFGKKRANALKQCGGARLTRVFDVDPGKARQLAAEFGAIAASGLNDIVAAEDIDAVLVAVDNKSHAEVCVTLLRGHKSVLCEKPLAHDLPGGEHISQAASESRGIFKLGANLRFFAAMQTAKKLLESGALGKIISVAGAIGHNGQLVKDKWYQRRAHSGGGTLLDNGSHLLDLFIWLFGPLKAKTLRTRRDGGFGDVEDYALAELESSDGIAITVEASWSRPKGYVDAQITGEQAALYIDTEWPYVLLRKNGQEEKIELKEEAPSAVAELNYFLDCVRAKRGASPSAADALKTLQLIQQLYAIEQK